MTSTRPTPALSDAPARASVRGSAIVYRLYDVGFEIDLNRAAERLTAARDAGEPLRVRPVRGEAQAIQIANPPITVALGAESVAVPGVAGPAEVSARIFDFGVVSLRVTIPAAEMSWAEFTAFGNAVDVGVDLTPIFTRQLASVLACIGPAVERQEVKKVTEDYV